MGIVSILSAHQVSLLSHLGKQPAIQKNFYLSGGTALAEYYLHHRYSEDLDFFSENEFDPVSVSTILKKIQKKVGFRKVVIEQSFNRNLFFLHFQDEVVKAEFTYYPFPQIEPSRKHNGVMVDSLLDISVNKLFTIYQRPRARDFIDLFCILKHEPKWSVDFLIKKAKIKFDWHVDPIQLGAQFYKVKEAKDEPRMIVRIPRKEWEMFFQNESKRLQQQFLEG
ncbi:MAG: nucleotidyl transferase AbiEii/AbiGii toxin family protein [Candidatus Kerfeldbacteria bacterium]|nr:nucleotidyl transferase AbiEii/AbiGii toxin family protein [Candidatus Kerfeldbacteria bacterium]